MRRFVQARTGALSVLALCFAASAALRAGDVLAERPDLRNRIAQATQLYEERIDPSLREGAAVMEEIARQRAALEAREAEIEAREAELGEVEARMEARLKRLQEVHARLRAEARQARDAAEGDVAHLAETYEAMKPKTAGQVFERMAPQFAAGFLARMSPDAAAGILASMSPERAYAVSVMLAGRNLHLTGEADTDLDRRR